MSNIINKELTGELFNVFYIKLDDGLYNKLNDELYDQLYIQLSIISKQKV